MKVQSKLYTTAMILGLVTADESERRRPMSRQSLNRKMSGRPSRLEHTVVSANPFTQQGRDLRAVPRSRGDDTRDQPEGRSKSGKQGKTGKGGEIIPPMQEMYYITPFSCSGQCIDAEMAIVQQSNQLSDAVVDCSNFSVSQLWTVNQDETFVTVESAAHPGSCISIDYIEGDDAMRIQAMCAGSVLTLGPCDEDSAEWYFTGGQLLSGFCWKNGISSNMGVFYDFTRNKCEPQLESYGSASGPFYREDSFMFFNSNVYFPPPPGGGPTVFPTAFPTGEPTIENTIPTYNPTYLPTANPTTSLAPSSLPSVSGAPSPA
mmetsp:Transcript_11457/g.23774  ORF Transcript_11457/g.23774 Transcript_11457/m.23774 type:complete len:318 (+) Transcript_11457:229-1182(+)